MFAPLFVSIITLHRGPRPRNITGFSAGLSFVQTLVEAAPRRQFISVRRPSRDSRYAAFLRTHCAYTLFSHMCYNRYPPHVDSNILYSTLLLALLFGCVCLRHTLAILFYPLQSSKHI